MHYSWLRGSYEGIEQMYIFHKLEIIRAVNTAISESAPLARVGIVEAVNALSFAEAGVGDNTASQVHLEGLHTMIEQADPGDRQRYQVYQQISQPLMFIIGAFMAAARRAGGEDEFVLTFHRASEAEDNETGTETGALPSSTPAYNQHFTPSLIPNAAAAWATAAYLYLNLLFFDGEWMPGGHGNPRLMGWLLAWVRVEPNDERSTATRSSSGELWLWRVVVGAYTLYGCWA